MEIFYTAFAMRLIFILGIINILSGIAVLLTCRCVGMAGLGQKLMKYSWFKRFYAFHCQIWWIFWVSVMVHAVFAIGSTGIPF